MNNIDKRVVTRSAVWLRPVEAAQDCKEQRERLLVCIHEAELMGFEATKSALVSMLLAIKV